MAEVSARELAYASLAAFRKEGAWSDVYLRKTAPRAELSPRDLALAAQLSYGVLQNRLLLDFWISRFSSVPLKKLEPQVLDILRLGFFQLAMLDRVPQSAAVNESVKLARRHSNPRAAGLVNAVLRAAAGRKDALPLPPREPRETYLSVLYSHPLWYVREMLPVLGPEETEALLGADNAPAPLWIQANSLKASPEEVAARLEGEGVSAEPHPWLSGCMKLSGAGGLERLSAWREGLFQIQDPASRLAVLAAAPEPGFRVIDGCAAPGGKSFAAAMEMKNRGSILSCDIYPAKLEAIREGAGRLGISVLETALLDASKPEPSLVGSADLVLSDVPCSGMGVIRKKPDIRYKDPDSLKTLPSLQLAILRNLSAYVKPGSVLLYSTCTLRREENEAVVRAFLDEAPGFAPESFRLPGLGEVPGGMLTLWPHRHGTDGFFICRMRKNI